MTVRGPGGGIESTLDRVAASSADGLSIRVEFIPDPPPGWIEVDQLLESDSLKGALFAGVAGVGVRPADHICAEWMVESFARALADLAGSCLVADRRLPDLDPGNLAIAPYKGMVGATAIRTRAMTALGVDREALEAGANPVPDWTDLADLMCDGLIHLLEPMVDWTDSQGLRPAKTLWQATGDVTAQSLVWSGKAFDHRARALELTRLLMDADSPLAVPVQRDLDDSGESYHLRSTCCLAYRTPEGGLCRSCPIARR